MRQKLEQGLTRWDWLWGTGRRHLLLRLLTKLHRSCHGRWLWLVLAQSLIGFLVALHPTLDLVKLRFTLLLLLLVRLLICCCALLLPPSMFVFLAPFFLFLKQNNLLMLPPISN